MKRSLLSLLLVFIVALLITLWQRPQELPQADANTSLFFPTYDAHFISRIEIEQLLDGVQLQKNGSEWKVAPLHEVSWDLADASRINAVLGIFGDLERGVLVSNNPEKQELYHVGKQGLELRLFNEKNELFGALLLGKNGPDLSSSYVRRSDEQGVYLVDRSLLGIFSIAAEDWELKPENSSEAASATLQATPKK